MSFAFSLARSFGHRLPAALPLSLLRPLYRSSYTGLRMASTLPRLPVFEAIARHDPDSTAVIHSNSGRRFRYGELLGDVCKVRNRLYETAGRDDIDGERIAFLVENSYDYVGKPIIAPPRTPNPVLPLGSLSIPACADPRFLK